MLADLAAALRSALGIVQKQDIQTAAAHLGRYVPHNLSHQPIRLGDDCAAIPDGDSYLLLAAEGLWPTLVEAEPWFAGWCAVMVNVSDIYAMGGHPIAVVDALWSASPQQADLLWQGMIAAAHAFNVPIVGGHTNCHSPYTALSVAILGRATQLLTSFDARPGDQLVMVTNLNGQPHPSYPFWDAATQAEPATLQRQLRLLPTIAEQGLCRVAKDISMGGIVGTALMLLEASGCGAILEIDAIPRPATVPLETWLLSFPSYGFLLSLAPAHQPALQALFQAADLTCQPIGEITAGASLILKAGSETELFWNLDHHPLTGFSSAALRA